MIPSSGEKSGFCFEAIARRGGSTGGMRRLLTRDEAARCNRRTVTHIWAAQARSLRHRSRIIPAPSECGPKYPDGSARQEGGEPIILVAVVALA